MKRVTFHVEFTTVRLSMRLCVRPMYYFICTIAPVPFLPGLIDCLAPFSRGALSIRWFSDYLAIVLLKYIYAPSALIYSCAGARSSTIARIDIDRVTRTIDKKQLSLSRPWPVCTLRVNCPSVRMCVMAAPPFFLVNKG